MLWRPKKYSEELALELAENLSQPLVMGQFLAARGFREADEVRLFLSPDLKSLPSPMTLPDMEKAVKRLFTALKTKQTVCVCGDYDADGITATALLAQGLEQFGHRVLSHIPERLVDGYGLRPYAMEKLAKEGVNLVVTVDNGISDHQAALKARELGLDLIITDHHRLPPELPPAYAIINPHLSADWDDSPLAGVGVAFMLLAALRNLYKTEGVFGDVPPSIMEALPLVAIGTIADLVPMTGANRALVRQGLGLLAQTRQPGLVALKKISSLGESAKISSRDVGFRLAPRLNAVGRLGSAKPALELLLCRDEAKADQLAAQLEEQNNRRRREQEILFQEALEKLETELPPDCQSVILAEANWPRGLLGLAASKVLERTGKPTILLSVENNQATGSGRSVPGFNLYQALNQLRRLFPAFGGHSQAAGLTLPLDNLSEFQKSFEKIAEDSRSIEEDTINYDCQSRLNQLDGLGRAFTMLEPFGPANPAPAIMIPQVKVLEARPTDSKSDRHLKLLVSDGLSRLKVVGFDLAPRLHEVTPRMDILLNFEISDFRGRLHPSWRLIDFSPAQ